MLILIITVLFILMIGFLAVRNDYLVYRRDYNFFISYLDFFNKIWRDKKLGFFNDEYYKPLITNIDRMNKLLGEFAFYKELVIPSVNGVEKLKDINILYLTIPKFRLIGLTANEVHALEDSFSRLEGKFSVIRENHKKRLYNPIVWFFMGFRSILGFPFGLFNWNSKMDSDVKEKIIGSKVFKWISDITALFALVDIICQIINPNKDLIKIIANLFK